MHPENSILRFDRRAVNRRRAALPHSTADGNGSDKAWRQKGQHIRCDSGTDGYSPDGRGTGVSAADRVRTVKAASAEGATPGDLRRPGHVFPLVAKAGGVLEREYRTRPEQ